MSKKKSWLSSAVTKDDAIRPGYQTPVDPLDDGLLWLINSAVFHPRGFALGLDPSTGQFCLSGDGGEPWVFASKTVGNAKFAAAKRAFKRARKDRK